MVDSSKLAAQIRESVDTGQPVTATLKTSSRIIARVTDGIYREPWAAFRELITNAYDADAKRVTIQTNAPTFSQIVVHDDGNGMNVDAVAYVLENIGGSSKRTVAGEALGTVEKGSPDKSPFHRPLIGKIGIGLFAVAQLTQHFQIVTKRKGDDYRTSATVVLDTFSETNLAENASSEYQPGLVTIVCERVPETEIDAQGTTISLYDLRPEIRWTLQSRRRWLSILARERLEAKIAALEAEGRFVEAKALRPVGDDAYAETRPRYHVGLSDDRSPGSSLLEQPSLPWRSGESGSRMFRAFFEAAGNTTDRERTPASLEHFDNYLKLIWQLSLALPLEYISKHPFDIDGASGIDLLEIPPLSQKSAVALRLEPDETVRDRVGLVAGTRTTDFQVEFDGLLLKRPIDLPHELRAASRLEHPVLLVGSHTAAYSDEELKRAGGPLRFEMYLYWNSKIVPKETNGVLIRIHEASGILFDPTFLSYKVSEQTRLRQITAEVFVHQGLDSALNIDRESFNYSHPHFLYIQGWLHRSIRILVNWLKLTSSTLIVSEREAQQVAASVKVEQVALSVWDRRRGQSADPPAIVGLGTSPSLPMIVAGQEIAWSDDREVTGRLAPVGLVKSIAVVLSAYRVFDDLASDDRADLINDLIALYRQVADGK